MTDRTHDAANRQSTAHTTLCEIVRCAEVSLARSDHNHPCAQIVRFQPESPTFQPPTPWVGRITSAPILFIGSNPNISGKEYYPGEDRPDGDLVAFFDGAFEEGPHQQIKGGIYARQADGDYGPWVRTWAGIRRRAAELLERDPVPGRDYAITEAVRCRSSREIGVAAAREHCAELYLERTVGLSSAKVIVGLGAHVRDWLRSRWELEKQAVSSVTVGEHDRLVAFLPHPTGFGRKTFQAVMPDELPELRAALRRAQE